jgi:hypothetical protein
MVILDYALVRSACRWEELKYPMRTISKRALFAAMLYMSSAARTLW